MLIAIWDSESEGSMNFINTAETFAEVLIYDDLDDLISASEEQVDLVVLDYDSDKKGIDKFVKKFRKEDEETKILILSNVLNPKQLVKHQNSKSGGDIYLRTPVNIDLLKSIFEPFFDISIDVEESDDLDISSSAPLSSEDKKEQTQIINEHQKVEMTEEAREASNAIQKKFDVAFPPEEDHAAAALAQIEEQEKLEAQEAENEAQMSDGLSLDDDSDDALSLGEDAEEKTLTLGDDDEDESGEGLSLSEEEDDDGLSLDDSINDEDLDAEDEQALMPNEDDLTYPDLSTDMLMDDDIENQESNTENTKEPDMSGHDEQDLEMNDLDGLELAADDEVVETAQEEEGMDLALDDGDALDLAADGDETDLTATVEDSSELDLGGDDGALELSEDGDSLESVEVVTDELDLDAPAEAPVEEEALDLGADDDGEALDLGGDDDGGALDLGADDDGEALDLGADDDGEALDLGADDDGEALDLGVDDDGEALDLGADDDGEALDLGADDDGEALDLGADDNGETLDLGADDDMDSLDLGGDDESMDLSSDSDDDGLNLEQEEQIDESIGDDLEFGVGDDLGDEAIEEAGLSASDLPAAPDGLDNLDDLEFGGGDEVADQDLSFDSEDTGQHSDDVMAKLAEIDAMMDDIPAEVAAQDEATGEHEIPPELHAQAQLAAIDEMTEVIPTNGLDDELDAGGLDDIGEDDLSFGADLQAEEPEQEKISAEAPIPKAPAPTPAASMPAVNVADHQAFVQHHGEELTRYGETIKNLREEREELLAQIQSLTEKNETLKRDQLAMKAELDEKKIELTIVKKRHEKQVDELKYHLDISNDKKDMLEEKNKQFEREYENLNRKIKVDLNKVRSRERDLENKLEMLRSDAEMQIKNRDQKILELKRKIDTLQFDVESMQVQERKVSSSNHQLEDKMEKVMRTLRRAIGELEEDGSSIRSIEEIKKNLDV